MNIKKSLKVKCLKIVALSVTAIMLLFSVANILHERQALEKRLQAYASLTIAITAQAIATPVWNIDSEALTAYLESFEEDPNFCGAKVIDNQGEILAESEKTLTYKNSLVSTRDIFFNNNGTNEKLGTLSLCFSKDYITRQISNTILLTSIVTFVLLLLVLYAVFYSIGIITKPLDAIRAALGNVADHMEKITAAELNQENEIGEVTKSFNVMIDDLINSHSALVAAKNKAEEANRLKSAFLANVSHELRTPLNSVLLLTEDMMVANNQNLTGEQTETLGVVNKNGKFLLSLINDLLDFAKIEAGKMTTYAEDISVEYLLGDVKELFTTQAEQKNLFFRMETSTDFPQTLHTDRTKLLQIIRNLVSNALKFTQDGGITVKCYRREDKKALAIAVSDTGIGIPDSKKEAIFQSFQQADSAIARKYGGTGLGLSISKALSELLGGGIILESIEGKGSTFTLVIPERLETGEEANFCLIKENHQIQDTIITPEPKVVNQEKQPEANIKSSQTILNDAAIWLKERKVIIIDDDMRNAFVLAKILKDANMQAFIAVDEDKIVELLQEDNKKADAMLVNMEKLGQTVQKVKKRLGSSLPPIIDLVGQSYQMGADMPKTGEVKGFLQKPVSIESLKDTLLQCMYPQVFGVDHGSA